MTERSEFDVKVVLLLMKTYSIFSFKMFIVAVSVMSTIADSSCISKLFQFLSFNFDTFPLSSLFQIKSKLALPVFEIKIRFLVG